MRTTTAFGKTALTSQGSQNSQTIISLSFFYYRKECTERPVTKEIEKCAKVGFKMSHNFALIITVKKTKSQKPSNPKPKTHLMKCNHRVWDRIFGADDKEAHGLIPLIWPRYFHSKCNRTGWSFSYPVITLLRDKIIWFKAKSKKNIWQLQKRELRKAPTQTEPPMQLTTRSFCDHRPQLAPDWKLKPKCSA